MRIGRRCGEPDVRKSLRVEGIHKSGTNPRWETDQKCRATRAGVTDGYGRPASLEKTVQNMEVAMISRPNKVADRVTRMMSAQKPWRQILSMKPCLERRICLNKREIPSEA